LAQLALAFNLSLIHHCKYNYCHSVLTYTDTDTISVKKTMVTLLGLPRVTISVVAIHKLLPNIMNLPFISGFVSSAIDTAAAEYVAPKSLTLDLQRLISGDDIKKDTDAIGVLVIHIHKAKDVKRMDATGGSGASFSSSLCCCLSFVLIDFDLSNVISRSIFDADVLAAGQTALLDAYH